MGLYVNFELVKNTYVNEHSTIEAIMEEIEKNTFKPTHLSTFF
jgi:hypothetical protein